MEPDQHENPRTRRVRRLVLDTAIEILLESGAQDVTTAIVAERAEVARTTIYRHWPDQQSLLLAAIEAMTTPHQSPQTTGPLADDVRTGLEHLRTRLVIREVRSVFGALAGYAAQHMEFQSAQRLFVNELTQPMVHVLQAAKQRGELSADRDCLLEANLLVGPILHQYLVLCEDISDHLLDEVFARWLTTT